MCIRDRVSTQSTGFLFGNPEMTTPEYTLYYWPIKARNSLIQYTASWAGIPLNWDRTADEDYSWKPWTPFGELPVITIKTPGVEKVEVLSQSLAIARYFAKIGGIFGDNAFEEARSDELIQAWDDVFVLVAKAHYSDNRKATMDSFFSETCPKKLKQFENLFRGETFFVDGKIRVGDLAVFSGLDVLVALQPNVLDETPKLKAFFEKLAAEPRIKAVRELQGVDNYFLRQ
eukprot:TRINITY_DN1466_c0_g1_i1.p1 TRINITY_DN1466_c0_g1~~TRINITY_DN1466_c0_g1_i1.p1  ORF type:complete len:230 (-),score=78.77 TRINITY_DN1466_c0_g1_i1:23-712(-)